MTIKGAAIALITVLAMTAVANARLSFDPTLEGGSGSSGGSGSTSMRKATTTGTDMDELLQSSLKPEELHDEFVKLMKARIQHEVWQLEERQSLSTWTNRVSFIIAAFVHLAVLLGVFAAGLEFWWARKTRQRSAKTQEIELSLEKIALKTSLQGMLLLLISLGLYLFYLKFVYAIH